MTEPESFDELEQLLRGLPVRQPAAALDERIARACRPAARRGNSKLLALGLAAGLLIAAAGLIRNALGPAPVVPVNANPLPVAVSPEHTRSVRQVSMIASGAGAFLPTITLLHCHLEPTNGKS